MKKRAAIVIALCVTISSAIVICGSLLYLNIRNDKANSNTPQSNAVCRLMEKDDLIDFKKNVIKDENEDKPILKILMHEHVRSCKSEKINELLDKVINGGNNL